MDSTALQNHLAALARANPNEHPFTLALRRQVATGREITGSQAAKLLEAIRQKLEAQAEFVLWWDTQVEKDKGAAQPRRTRSGTAWLCGALVLLNLSVPPEHELGLRFELLPDRLKQLSRLGSGDLPSSGHLPPQGQGERVLVGVGPGKGGKVVLEGCGVHLRLCNGGRCRA